MHIYHYTLAHVHGHAYPSYDYVGHLLQVYWWWTSDCGCIVGGQVTTGVLALDGERLASTIILFCYLREESVGSKGESTSNTNARYEDHLCHARNTCYVGHLRHARNTRYVGHLRHARNTRYVGHLRHAKNMRYVGDLRQAN